MSENTDTYVYLSRASVKPEPAVHLNPGGDGGPFAVVHLGPLEITPHDPEHARKIAAAFTEAARLLEETRPNAICGTLNAYEKMHSPEAMAYDPESIWRDVIRKLPTYDAKRTDGFTDCDRFALTDGTVIRWEAGRVPLWQVDEPGDITCAGQDQKGEHS